MRFLKNRTVLGVLCIVLSLIICFAVTPLFNKERRLMEIMECEILADGTRRYRPLFQYQITENRVEDGKFVIVGHHRQINPISDSLARRLMENGMPQETLAGLLNVKKDREEENE